MLVSEALASATHTKELLVGRAVYGRAAELIRRVYRTARAMIVADQNTMRAAGEGFRNAIEAGGVTVERTLVFPGKPVLHAEYTHVERIRDFLARDDSLAIAVGGGTINDLVKRAAFELHRPYLVVATAASVDGYTAFGAALVNQGYKMTMECDAPRAVVADVDVLCAAPQPMTAAGYGDLVAKSPGGVDWIIADALEADPINPLGWRMVQEDLKSWISDPEGIGSHKPATIELLFSGLAVTGFTLQAMKNSRPVSGSEHLLSHVWEMQNLEFDGRPVSHGFKVALGSLATTALFEILIDTDIQNRDLSGALEALPEWPAREKEIRAAWAGSPAVEAVVATSKTKHPSRQLLARRMQLFKERWPKLKADMTRQLIPYAELHRMFAAAHLPLAPEAVGLTRERAVDTARLAQMIRNRYTILDLMYEFGLYDEFTSRLAGSKVYWR